MYSFGSSTTNTAFDNAMKSSVRSVDAKVELYNTSGTLVATFLPSNYIKSFEIQRTGNGKFFGSVVAERLSLKLLPNSTSISSGMYVKPYIGSTSSLVPYPKFKITEINKDEETGGLSITAYDVLHSAEKITVDSVLAEINAELQAETISSYTLDYILQKCAEEIGCESVSSTYTSSINGTSTALRKSIFTYNTESPVNLDGTESIRDVLQWMADVSCSVMYIQNDGRLAYKRIKQADSSVKTVDKDLYFKLDSKTNRRFIGLCKVTDLGDNIESKQNVSGTIFYIRNNPFLELPESTVVASFLDTLRTEVVSNTTNFSITQFNCKWRGNPRLEFGDKISLVDKANGTFTSYVYDETITYNGGLESEIKWEYATESDETANSSTLGDVLNSTYARVDKANKRVDIVAGSVDGLNSQMSSWELTTNGIVQTVSETQQRVKELEDDTTDANAIKTLETKLTTIDQKADSINLSVQTIQQTGVDKITTSTGYTFDEEGLTVSKSTSDISTTITDDGMRVKRNGEDVLVANNQGVDAVNLHASTYLIIGSRSRFEDYDADGDEWTACFWIGG